MHSLSVSLVTFLPASASRSSPPCVQFGLTPILDYLTHQRRLFPALAATYAMHLAMLQLKQIVVKVGGGGWAGK